MENKRDDQEKEKKSKTEEGEKNGVFVGTDDGQAQLLPGIPPKVSQAAKFRHSCEDIPVCPRLLTTTAS